MQTALPLAHKKHHTTFAPCPPAWSAMPQFRKVRRTSQLAHNSRITIKATAAADSVTAKHSLLQKIRHRVHCQHSTKWASQARRQKQKQEH